MDTRSKSKPWLFLYVLLLFSYKTHGADTISAGQSLSGSQTPISQGGIFELGFFRPGNSADRFYIGIWYKNFSDRVIVWVANRNIPFSNPSRSELKLSKDGNLVILSNSKIIWSTDLPCNSTTSSSLEAVLLDSGNFVLRDGPNSSALIWQSFDHPTDTWLPGAKFRLNKLTKEAQPFTSWRNSEDPSTGMFSVGLDPNGSSRYSIQWNSSKTYWTSGVWKEPNISLVPENRSTYLYNYSYFSNENENYFTYSVYNTSILCRIVMDLSGQFKQYVWLDGVWYWNLFWSQPRRQCNVYGLCGAFSGCNEQTLPFCECLQGFKPRSSEETSLSDWSGGCVRLQCQNNTSDNGNEDGFIEMHNTSLPEKPQYLPIGSDKECKLACLNKCACTACAYNSNGCSIWDGDLLNMFKKQEAAMGNCSTANFPHNSYHRLLHMLSMYEKAQRNR
ncbi:hypothetical protein HHK36_005474 [Tetracentron sinense]|uniref:Uncharacterized protein n=1 Tax=Tetracentron sinense TaxID=13715 RepID=A0A835DMC1_TETSI|nr:hypothetical protein HHK36_005474 [Tetracentron sinense]